MAMYPPSGTTDHAGQVAIIQGVDSNVFQTTDPLGGPPIGHPAAYTSIEGSLGLITLGRVSGDVSDLRAFGRFVNYEPLTESFESRAARGGLSYRSSSRLDRRTTLVTTLLGSVGSLQAARGTDAALTMTDPVSTRRSTWAASGTETFAIEVSPISTVRVLAGLDIMGTLSETIPGQQASIHRGLDFVVGRSRISLTRRLDARTFVEGALLVERMRTEYVLDRGDPAGRVAGPIDGAATTATLGGSRLIGRQTTATAAIGVAFARPQIRKSGQVLPVASLGVVHSEEAWSFSALAGLQYALAQPRVGPGPSTTLALILIGKPFSGPSRNKFDVVAEASGQQTWVTASVNDGSRVTSGGGSLTMRWAIADSVGLLFGYDVRASRLSAATDGSPPWYVRHMGFVGLSYAWLGSGAISTLPTLARPAVAPFAP